MHSSLGSSSPGIMTFFNSLNPEEEGTVISHNIGTTHPVTQCHITEDFNPELWDVLVLL